MRYFLLLPLLLASLVRADQRVVLAEYSTNSSCIPCVAATHQFDHDLDALDRSKFAVVRYHTPNPNTIDPFYQSNKSEANARATTYGWTSNPQLRLDGKNAQQDYTQWNSYMTFELTQASPASIALSGSFNTDTGTVHVTLTQLPAAGERFYAVLTETGIEFTGANNEQVHDDVFQKCLTTWAGLAPTSLQFDIPFSLGTNSSTTPQFEHQWNPDSCRIVVWIQNPTTLDVAQAAQEWVTALSPIKITEPAPGTEWSAGSTQQITWMAQGVANVEISYALDGTQFEIITPSTDATVGHYDWTLPTVPQTVTTAYVKIRDVASQAVLKLAGPFTILAGPNGIHNVMPTAFTVEQNFPNPFAATTEFTFSLASTQHVCLRVFDTKGAMAATVIDEVLPRGLNRVAFDASSLPAGLYEYRMTTPTATVSKLMTLAK